MDFTLRPWREEDIASVARYANNEKIAKNLRNVFPYPYTLQDAADYVRACIQADEAAQCCRAIVVDGEAVGSIGAFLGDDVYCKSAELGYWLGEPFWRRGIMSSAVRQLCDEVFADYDVVRIHAEPYADNAGSRRVLERAGFRLEGIKCRSVYKNGVFHDSCMYALLKALRGF